MNNSSQQSCNVVTNSLHDPNYKAATLFLTVAVLVAHVLLNHRNNKKQRKRLYNGVQYDLPPYPPFTFFETGKALTDGRLPWFFLDCTKSVGNIFQLNVPVPGGMIVCGNGELQKQISEHSTTLKDEAIYKPFQFVFNGNPVVLTTEGYEWKRRIKAVSPAFAKSHITRMNKVCMTYHEQWMKENLKESDNESFDVGQEMEKLTVQVIAKAAFEYEMSNDEAQQYVDEMSIALCEYRNRANSLVRMIFGSWWSVEGRRGILATRRLHEFAKKVIVLYQQKQATKASTNEDNTLIRCIMNNDTYKDDNERAADINVFFLAGHDTTGNSIAWTLLELARDENQKELLHLRNKLSAVPPDEWSKLPALQNVIKEGMRLHPVIAGGPVRRAGKDFFVKGTDGKEGTVISKGSNIIMPNILTGRDPNVFEEPTKFKPSRWNDKDTSAKWNREFFPFATGRHSCPGQALANAEINTVIARMIMNYDLTIVEEGTATWESTTMKPIGAILQACKVNASKVIQ